MIVTVNHECANYDSFRANKVKSLFNPERGNMWSISADLPIENGDWQIGLIVGPSGSGKSSLGAAVWPGINVHDLYSGWQNDLPIIDCISPESNLNNVTAALSAVGLGDVPAWLRPFNVLSNGEKFRAGLARLICESPDRCIVDEFTSVIDRQIAQIGAAAFSKSWRRSKKQIILLSCHYDIVDWLQPDWVYDTSTQTFKKKEMSGQQYGLTSGRLTAVTGNCLKSITI